MTAPALRARPATCFDAGRRPLCSLTRLPLAPLPSCQLFYALAVIILLSLALAAWLAIVLKKDGSTQSGWIAK